MDKKESQITINSFDEVFLKAVLDVVHTVWEQDSQLDFGSYALTGTLMDRVGNFAQEFLKMEADRDEGRLKTMREEAVRVAAVSLAIVECLDREKWGFQKQEGWDEMDYTVNKKKPTPRPEPARPSGGW